MPCYQVRTTSVQLETANVDWLKEAIESLGYRHLDLYYSHGRGPRAVEWLGFYHEGQLVKVNFNAKTMVVPEGCEEVIRLVKQSYTRRVLREAGKMGWDVKETSPGNYTMSKNSFTPPTAVQKGRFLVYRDAIKMRMLEDGTLSIQTDGISPENHQAADNLVRFLEENLGGSTGVVNRKGQTGLVGTQQAAAQKI